MKMEEVGYKSKDCDMGTSPSGDKNKMHYPRLSFNDKIPANLKDKDVGESCMLMVEGEISGKSKDEYGESLSIEVHKIGYSGKAVEKSKYDKMSPEDKDKADEEEVMGKK